MSNQSGKLSFRKMTTLASPDPHHAIMYSRKRPELSDALVEAGHHGSMRLWERLNAVLTRIGRSDIVASRNRNLFKSVENMGRSFETSQRDWLRFLTIIADLAPAKTLSFGESWHWTNWLISLRRSESVHQRQTPSPLLCIIGGRRSAPCPSRVNVGTVQCRNSRGGVADCYCT